MEQCVLLARLLGRGAVSSGEEVEAVKRSLSACFRPSFVVCSGCPSNEHMPVFLRLTRVVVGGPRRGVSLCGGLRRCSFVGVVGLGVWFFPVGLCPVMVCARRDVL